MPEPNFFILGAPKCGTTSLSRWLAAHPHIFMCRPKEPHYFNTDESFRNVTSEDAYRQLFAQAGPEHLAIGEASTWYLHSQAAVANILDFAPAARFIVCLRNPVDMAFSLHGHFLLSGREHIASFEAAWAAAPERLAGRQLGRWTSDPRYLAYPQACATGSQLQRLLQTVPRERVHLVVLDDMRHDPTAVYRACLEFLEVPDDGRATFTQHNRRQHLRSVPLHRLMLHLRALRRALGLESLGRGWGRRISRRATPAGTQAQLSVATRQQLTDYFATEIRLLWSLCEREYPQWLSPGGAERT